MEVTYAKVMNYAFYVGNQRAEIPNLKLIKPVTSARMQGNRTLESVPRLDPGAVSAANRHARLFLPIVIYS